MSRIYDIRDSRELTDADLPEGLTVVDFAAFLEAQFVKFYSLWTIDENPNRAWKKDGVHYRLSTIDFPTRGLDATFEAVLAWIKKRDTPDPYPLHTEMKARAAERLGVQVAVDWIMEQGYSICEDRARPAAQYTDYQPIRLQKDQLVAAIMEIDYKAFNAEKDQMVEDMRQPKVA